MLWLSGLMGIAGAGAASFIEAEDADDDFSTPEMDLPDHDQALLLHGDMLEQLDRLDAGPGTAVDAAFDFPFDEADAFPMEFDGPLQQGGLAAEDGGAAFEAREDLAEALDDEPLSDADAAFAQEDHALPPVLLGNWIAEGPPDEVFDYDAKTESLVLIWDDMGSSTAEPDVQVEEDAYDPEVMHVMMNGKGVAEIYGDPNLTAADVTVIPLSSALIVGLEPS